MAKGLAQRSVLHRPSFSWPLWTVMRSAIRTGRLKVRDRRGEIRVFGDGSGKPIAIHFHHEHLAVFQIQLARQVDAVPLTRACLCP